MLQKMIEETIPKFHSKNIDDNELCLKVSVHMETLTKKHWNCMIGCSIAQIAADENAANFIYEGKHWILSSIPIQVNLESFEEKSALLEQEKARNENLEEKVKELEEKVKNVETALDAKEKEHTEFVKKMDATKAVIEKILQDKKCD